MYKGEDLAVTLQHEHEEKERFMTKAQVRMTYYHCHL